MIRRLAHWRAGQLRLAAVDRYLEAQLALMDSDPGRHEELVAEAEHFERRATWWSRVANRRIDWRRRLRALLYDDPEAGS